MSLRTLNRNLFRVALEEEDLAAAALPVETPEPVAAEPTPAAAEPAEIVAPAATEPVAEPAAPAVDVPARASATDLIARAQARASQAAQADATPAEPAAEPTPAEPVAVAEPAPVVEVPAEPAAVAAEPAAEPAAAEPVVAEEVPAVAEEDLIVIDESGDEAGALLDDASHIEGETDALADDMDRAESAAGTLTEIHQVAERAQENGGLTEDAGRILEVATEGIYELLGIEKPEMLRFGMESFSTVAARTTTTAWAMEAIGDTVKSIWEKIAAAFKAMGQWLTEFFKRVFTSNGRAKARAQKIVAAAEKLGSALPKQTEVGNAKLVAALSINGQQVKNPSEYVKKLSTWAQAAFGGKAVESLRAVDVAIGHLKSKTADEAGKQIAEAEFSKGVHAAIVATVSTGMSKYTGSAGDIGLSEVPAGTELYTSPWFIGDKAVWAFVPSDLSGEDGGYALGSFKTGVAGTERKYADDAKLKTLIAPEIIRLAKECEAFCVGMDKYKATQAEVSRALNSASAAIAGFIAAGHGMTAVDEAEKAGKNKAVAYVKGSTKGIAAGMRAARALTKGIHQPAMTLAASTVNNALEYAAESLKAYNKAKEAAPLQLENKPSAA